MLRIHYKLLLTFILITSSVFALNSPKILPEEALQKLIDGNKRFADDKLINCAQTQARREETVEKQRPFAVVLGCSDSRVPPEVVFDQQIGDVFTIRVAGNVVSAIEQESIEYSVIYNDSSLIVVLGHENCGAIKAVLAHQTKDIETIASLIEPAISQMPLPGKAEPITAESATKANIQFSVQKLRKIPILKESIDQKKLKIIGGYYNLNTGIVEILPDITKD